MKNLIVLFISINFVTILHAQNASWSFELHGGVPYNIPASLVIDQQNEEIIKLNAEYNSEPITAPYYWVWRISRWQNNKSWEFEAIHHKLYLDNKPDGVQRFSISHGYNILTINRSFKKTIFQKYPYILRFGAGLVLSHPENTIRNKEFYQHDGIFELGYYFTGPVINLSVAKRFYIIDWVFINTELKFNPSYSLVPIEDGQARLWNFPVAFAFGLGIDFNKNESKPEKPLFKI